MDPVTVGAISGILQLIEQYGFPAVGVILVFFAARGVVQIIRAWRDGLFFPKSFVDQVLALKDERLKELQDRYVASQDGIKAWRANSEAALKAAEAAQERQKQVLAQGEAILQELARTRQDMGGLASTIRSDVAGLRDELGQLRDDFSAYQWGQAPDPPPPLRRPPGRPRERE